MEKVNFQVVSGDMTFVVRDVKDVRIIEGAVMFFSGEAPGGLFTVASFPVATTCYWRLNGSVELK